MAKRATAKHTSAKQVAIDVLRAAGEPLKAKEITKRVIDSGRREGLKGRTPEATISAMLAVGSKSGGLFKRVDKGTYTLAQPTTVTTATEAQPTSAKMSAKTSAPARARRPHQPPKRQPGKRQTKRSRLEPARGRPSGSRASVSRSSSV
jgi:hypothetical protein